MQSKVEATYDDFAATCAVLNRNGLCEQITNPVIKQVHLLLAAMQETTVAAAAAGADASGRLRAVLLEVAKCRLGAAFTDEATLASTWPQEYGGKVGHAMVSEGCAHRA
jgi:hypothetical protein